MPERMISDKPLRVIRFGVDATFEPGVERLVRDSLVEPAQKMGARIVGTEPVAKEPESDPKPSDETIRNAIQQLLDENKQSAFAASGAPKVRPIEAILGANIDAEDRDRVWESMSDAG